MSGHPIQLANDQGMAYVALLFLLIILLTLGLSFLYTTGTETAAVMARSEHMQAEYLAEAAANHALWRLKNETNWTPDEGLYYMNTLGTGRYGYKVRAQTPSTFATVSTVGAVGDSVVEQSYVLNFIPEVIQRTRKLYWSDLASGKIQRSDLEGVTIEDLATSVIQIGGFAIDERGAKVYWADRSAGAIRRANVDGTGVESVLTGLTDITAVAVDPIGGKVYWADRATKKIQRASLNGLNKEDIIVAGATNVSQLIVNPTGGKIYWADVTTAKIVQATLSGTGVANFATVDTKTVISMAVDPTNGKIYWTDKTNAKVLRANLDGTGKVTIASLVVDPTALLVDDIGGKVYWADASKSTIRSANLDGTLATDIATAQKAVPALTIDHQDRHLFWAETSASVIRRANLDGSSPVEIVRDLKNLKYLRLGSIERGVHFQTSTEARLREAGTSLILKSPAGTYEGDLLVAALATNGNSAATLTAPSGEKWNLIDVGMQGDNVTLGVWWRLAGTNETGDHLFTWGKPQVAYGWVMQFTGHNHNAPVSTMSTAGSLSATPVSPRVMTALDKSMILRIGAFNGSSINPGSTGVAAHADIIMGSSNQDTGILGYWKLDEKTGKTAVDSSGNRYSGTLVNMTGTEWTTGMVGGALKFDGSNDAIQMASNATTLQITGDYSASLWIRADATQQNGAGLYNRRDSTSKINHFSLEFSGTGSHPLQLIHGTKNDTWTSSCNLTELSGDWHHLAVTWQAASGISQIFVDGVLRDQSNTLKTPPVAGAGRLNIARSRNVGSWGEFKGSIDDLRIYDRVLTPNDVLAVMGTKVSFRSYAEARVPSDQTSITIPLPASSQSGDLLIAAVATDGKTDSELSPAVGSGWTKIQTANQSGAVTLGAWWKFVAAGEPVSHTFSWKTPEQAYGWIMRFTGHNVARPVETIQMAGGSGTAPLSPALTTASEYNMILRLGAFDAADITEGVTGLAGHQTINMGRSVSSNGVSYLGFQEAKLNTSGTSLTIANPTGTSTNDLMIASVVVGGPVASTLAAPAGEGWTLLDRSQQGNVTLGVWWKLASATEVATHKFTWTGSLKAYGWISRYTGHDLTTPINTFTVGSGASSSTPTAPAITTTVPSAMIVRIGGFEQNSVTLDSPGLSGHTTITMDSSGTSGTPCSGGSGYLSMLSAGTSSAVNFALTAPRAYRTLSLAITAAGGGGTYAVSGGSGFAQLPTRGTSGTANFALNADRAAAMLTIAIAPEMAASVSGGAAYLYQGLAGLTGEPTFGLTAPQDSRLVTIALSPAEEE